MTVWVGSYGKKGGKGLYRLAMDAGHVVVNGVEPRITNASFGVVSTKHGVAYFVDERNEGRVAAWRYSAGWHPMSVLPSGGAAPCYLALSPDERWLACANYDDGAVAVFRLDSRSGDLVELVSHFAPSGSGPDLERQDGPHAHCVIFTNDGAALYHVDLGLDRVFRHELDQGQIVASNVAFAAPSGAGPRHLLFHPDGVHALLICELSARLLLLRHAPDGTFNCVHSSEICPETTTTGNLGGHLAIDAEGRVLVTNRGHDSLVRFAIRNDKLAMLDWHHTGGESPRHFGFWQDRFLVAHEESGSLTQVRWDQPATPLIAALPGAAFVIDAPD